MMSSAKTPSTHRTTVVRLDPADYWQLMTFQRDVLLARSGLATAVSKHAALLVALAPKYPALQTDDAHYTADDTTHSLTLSSTRPTA